MAGERRFALLFSPCFESQDIVPWFLSLNSKRNHQRRVGGSHPLKYTLACRRVRLLLGGLIQKAESIGEALPVVFCETGIEKKLKWSASCVILKSARAGVSRRNRNDRQFQIFLNKRKG